MSAPLSGITILDLTHVLAGPYASMTLADLGARVIKVERPGIGDDTRAFPPFKDAESAYFATINHGKESIALDLKDGKDRAIFDQLLAQSDVVLENYRPGVMEKLGYGWEDLHERFPALIYGAVSGFGHTGPEALKPAYDMVVQARGGVMSITGERDREPVRVGASIGDIVAGMFLAQGILAALLHRRDSGLGQKVDIAMLDCQLALLEHAIAITSVTDEPPPAPRARGTRRSRRLRPSTPRTDYLSSRPEMTRSLHGCVRRCSCPWPMIPALPPIRRVVKMRGC